MRLSAGNQKCCNGQTLARTPSSFWSPIAASVTSVPTWRVVHSHYSYHNSLIPAFRKKSEPHTMHQEFQLAGIPEYTSEIRYIKGKAHVVNDALFRVPLPAEAATAPQSSTPSVLRGSISSPSPATKPRTQILNTYSGTLTLASSSERSKLTTST